MSHKTINKEVLIRKSNDLVEARYKFDIWETRIFYKMLTLIQYGDKDFYEYKICINDLIHDFSLENNKDSYFHVREGAMKLMSKIVRVVLKDETEGCMMELHTPLITGVKKILDETDEPGFIKVSFHPDMKPFLLELKQRYLVYEFRNVSELQSPYYIRIYELLKQYEKIGERRLTVSELKEILGIGEEYSLYGHFKSSILNKAQRKIAQHTDIAFSYTEIKRGRAVAELVFKIWANKTRSVKTVLTDLETIEEVIHPEEVLPTYDFQKYVDWLQANWGVAEHEFRKRMDNKSEDHIKTAIRFTQQRLHEGKAKNPAGVFLECLQHGWAMPTLFQEPKSTTPEQQVKENPQAVLSSEERQQQILATVRQLTFEDPLLTEQVIQELQHPAEGIHLFADKTVDDFRQDEALRLLVIERIIALHPDRFRVFIP